MIYFTFFPEHEKSKNKDFQHKTAHSLLAGGLLSEYSVRYEDEEIGYGADKKPFLPHHPEIHFNLSHCNGCAACIIDSSPVGIDVENIRKFDMRTAKRVCTEAEFEFIEHSDSPEKAFFKLWTLKESAVKNTGTGITVPLKNYEFSIAPDNTVVSNHPEFSFTLTECGNFIISICKSRLS